MNRVLTLIKNDPWRMKVLQAAASLDLPDWCIGAGFVRNKVWDHVHKHTQETPPTDIDLVYFDPRERYDDSELAQKLSALMPEVNWEVTNQAIAHIWNDDDVEYSSTKDALSKWPETATAVGVRLEQGHLVMIAPHGVHDLWDVIARPTPWFAATEERKEYVRRRVTEKGWLKKWPNLRMLGL
jgi:hypothetical protein